MEPMRSPHAHVRPALAVAALCGAAMLVLPPQRAGSFTTLGFSLSTTQRDFRVFNNFADAGANDNVTPDPNFPGSLGAVMAIWKGAVEWGSELHGDGNGDPHQPGGLGSGGANFDFTFQGEATGVGGINDNVVSEISSCGGGGVLAFTEAPSSNGWRIRFCGEISYKDGPGASIGSGIDIQGVAAHQLGQALGLGFSSVSSATMSSFLSDNGVTSRSIAPDDIAGVQAVYGVRSSTKPSITGVALGCGGVLTISGTNFAATGNDVWFTQGTSGGSGQPVKVQGVSSTGGTITVTVPASAGAGDVLVQKGGASGGSSLSNAWPLDTSAPGLPSSELVRAGSPPNPLALTPGSTSGPVLGSTWDPSIDHTTFLPGAFVDVLGITAASTNIPFGVLGTLLCDVSGSLTLFASTPGVAFTIPVPSDCTLEGVTLCAQGISADAAATRLTNALDITIGSN